MTFNSRWLDKKKIGEILGSFHKNENRWSTGSEKFGYVETNDNSSETKLGICNSRVLRRQEKNWTTCYLSSS